MTAPEDAIDVIATLRRARPQLPDEVVSPASEAAQALLEEILSMRIPEIDLVPTDPVPTDPGPRRPRRSRRPLVLAAATAVAVAGIAAVAAVVTTGDGGGGSVEVGPATGGSVVPGETTTPAGPAVPADTGRLRVTGQSQWGPVPPMGEDTTYSWSGDDFGVKEGLMTSGTVGDQSWNCTPDWNPGSGPPPTESTIEELLYRCDVPARPRPAVLDIDPAALLDQLAAAGPFTPVGDEDVEGVPTQRRRATNLASTPLDALAFLPIFPDDAEVTSLEVWVDGDDRVLRVDVATAGVAQGDAFTETISYTWYDLGEPVAIEPVATGDVIDPEELRELLEDTIDESTPTNPESPQDATLTPETPEPEVGG